MLLFCSSHGEHFLTRPGHALLPNHFVAVAAKKRISMEDIKAGLEYGGSLGWFEPGPNDSVVLTADGFAEM
jgi:hypothetical protein